MGLFGRLYVALMPAASNWGSDGAFPGPIKLERKLYERWAGEGREEKTGYQCHFCPAKASKSPGALTVNSVGRTSRRLITWRGRQISFYLVCTAFALFSNYVKSTI